MRLPKCTWCLARSFRPENPRRRRRSWQGPVDGVAVGRPQSCPAGAVVFFSKGEAGRFSRSVVALCLIPLPRFPSARGGVMNILLATFSAVLGPLRRSREMLVSYRTLGLARGPARASELTAYVVDTL